MGALRYRNFATRERPGIRAISSRKTCYSSVTFLMLCTAPMSARAFQDDVSFNCGRLQGTHHDVTLTCGVNLGYGLTDWFAINAVYLNEGHLPNHHRDGFAVQPSLYKDLGKWRVQLATGPYYTMDTTQPTDGMVRNDKRLGVLSSVALKWHPTAADWYVGVGYNHVWMPNGLHSNSELIILGIDTPADSGKGNATAWKTSNAKWGLWAGPGNTTHPESRITEAGQVEISFALPLAASGENSLLSRNHLSYSFAGLYEGNTSLTDRRGGMAQLWYNGRFDSRWTLSAGAGPYLAYDALRDIQRVNLAVVASMRATYQLTRATAVGLNFNRVVSFYHRDADIFLLGIQRAW